MGLIRIYFDEDNVLRAVDWPSIQVNTAEEFESTFRKCKKFEQFNAKIVDSSLLPTGEEFTEQLYLDGDQIKLSENKDKGMMPAHIIKSKHIKNLISKLDAELEKETPDSIIVARLQREKEKCREYTEKDWYEIALQKLDERVVGGEPDKPVIREKLKSKIEELKGE